MKGGAHEGLSSRGSGGDDPDGGGHGAGLGGESGRPYDGAYSNGNTPSASLADTVTTNVRANLEGDKLCKGAVLTVATSPTGKVTLAGSVPNVTAKQQAIELAKGTPGVTEVDDQMRVIVSSPQGPSQD